MMSMVLNFLKAVFGLAVLSCSLTLAAAPTIEDFGQLPNISDMAISPDGQHIAYIGNEGPASAVIIRKLATGETVGGMRLNEKTVGRSVYFASDDHVIIRASDTQNLIGYNRNRLTITGSFAYSIKSKKAKLLLNGSKNLHPAQSGLGRIVAVNGAENRAYMPGFGDSGTAPYNLYSVDLDTGKGRRLKLGKSYTEDWFVGSNGKVLAREDYNDKNGTHSIVSYTSGKPETVYSAEVDMPELIVQAVSHDESKLIFTERGDSYAGAKYLDLTTGAITPTRFSKAGTYVLGLRLDLNRKLEAVVYNESPFYEFLDPRVQPVFRRMDKTFKRSAIAYLGASSGMKQMLFRVSGNSDPHAYTVLNTKKVALTVIGEGYPNIKKDDLGEVVHFEYAARDELEIPAILTWPAGSDAASRKNLPLLVLPHGGPESNDVITFDWWAQYFANKGYLVLQPNFRGSTGYGREFTLKGYGKWGKEMQDDVTDGVKHLISEGIADSQRVCIMGASYGGYSALAGGAFTPDVYRCVISFAGVSDLPLMLQKDTRDHGANHWVVSYWKKVLGGSLKDADKLSAVSPVNFADQFKAPVLLLHGKDDTVVSLKQSKRMQKALKKAGKQVKLVTLKGEDHWLSTSEMRLRMLKEVDAFVAEHNPI